MKRVVIIVAGALAVFLVAASTLLWLVFDVPHPPQPKFGFTGAWGSTDVFGYELRPLPPAAEVWQDYGSWSVPADFHGSRLYLARLGEPAGCPALQRIQFPEVTPEVG